MADRSPDDSVPDQSVPAAATGTGPPRARTAPAGASSQGGDLTQRIKAAYDSSGPVVSDAPADRDRPSGAQRFAAALNRTTKETGKGGPGPAASPSKPARKARLRLTHIDPWSVMKTAFLLAVALGIVTVVAAAVVWSVLDAAGVWTSIDQAVGDVVGDSASSFRIEDYLGLSRVLGFTMIVAVVDVILVTVLATLGAFLYNLAAALLGGLEVVLAEDESVR